MSIRSHDLARAAYGVVSARQQLPDDERKNTAPWPTNCHR